MTPEDIPQYHRANRSAFTRWFGRTLLKVMGWQVEGQVPTAKKLIVAGAPHTSNWDFVIAMAVVMAMDIKAHWLAKHTIFKFPLRQLFFSLGGIPLDRTNTRGVAEQVAQKIRVSDAMIIGIMPEGTRKKVDKWKSGFLRIARAAECPVLLASLDFSRKRVRFGELVEAQDDTGQQLLEIKEYFQQFQPRYPEKF